MAETLTTFSELVAQEIDDLVEPELAQAILTKLASIDDTRSSKFLTAAYYVRKTFMDPESIRFYMRNYLDDHHGLSIVLHHAGLTEQEKAIVINALAGQQIVEVPPIENEK